MTKNQLLALAAFITTLANGEETTTTDAAPAPDAPKRRGRPPTTEKSPEEKPADEKPAETKKAKDPDPQSQQEALQKLRATIDPFVKANRGLEVKEIIKSFTPDNWPAQQVFTLTELSALPELHAEFEQKIKALEY